jgi:hypothetical protein
MMTTHFSRRTPVPDPRMEDDLMKRAFLIALTCLILLPVSGFSQTRRRTAAGRRGRAAASSKTASETRATAAKLVAEKIKALSQFLFLLGGIAREIEATDSAGQASPAVVQQMEANKAKVKDSLRNIREGLDQLEINFRGQSDLQPYYEGLAGVAAGAAAAEDQARANRFTAAGRSLLPVVNRLTDVLLAMR